MLGHGSTNMPVGLAGSGHPVHLALAELGHPLGLGTGRLLIHTHTTSNTVGTPVRRTLATLGRARLRAKTLGGGLGGIHVHGVGVLGGVAAAGHRAATSGLANLGTSAKVDLLGIDTELVDVILELGERLLLHFPGDYGAVLERLLHLGLVADELVLLADVLGLLQDLLLRLVAEVRVRLVEALLLETLLLLFESGQLGFDIGIDEIVDVLAVDDLGNLVVLPLGVGQEPLLPEIDVEDTSTTVLLLDIPGQKPPLGVGLVVLLEALDTLGDEGLAENTIGGLGDVDTGHDLGKTRAHGTVAAGTGLVLLVDTLNEESLANDVLDFLDTVLGGARGAQKLNVARLGQVHKVVLGLLVELLNGLDIHLVQDNVDHLVLEKGLDRPEKVALGLERVTALLGDIDEEHDGGSEMGESSNGLHFNGVHLLERVVENTRGIDDLVTEVLVVEMADEQALGGESIRLDRGISAGDGAHERRLADIGEAGNEESTGGRVDIGQTGQMLADLVEVGERVFETLDEGGHTTKGGSLQLLALVKRLRVLEETDVITRDGLDQVLSGRNLTEGNLEMVGICPSSCQLLFPSRPAGFAIRR